MDICDVVDRWRVVPRILVAGYGYLVWDSAQWFMGLSAPTAPQAAFISTLVGAAAGVFGLYASTGGGKGVGPR